MINKFHVLEVVPFLLCGVCNKRAAPEKKDDQLYGRTGEPIPAKLCNPVRRLNKFIRAHFCSVF